MNALVRLHRRLLPDDPTIGWTPYLWLVYLAFFFIRYLYVTPGAGEIVGVAVTLVAFLWLYFVGYWQTGGKLMAVIAGMVAIGAVWAPVNVGAGVFFIYAASFTSWLGPVRRAVTGAAAVVGVAMLVALFWQWHPVFWLAPLIFGPLVSAITLFQVVRQRQDAALRLSQEEVRQLERVAERERIARDLHDLLGHTLSVITLKAELAGRLIGRDPDRAAAEIREVEEVSRTALAQVREAVAGMRERGLAGELAHARVALKAAAVELEVDGQPPAVLPPVREAVLALVVREAVTNVIRHAQAATCRIVLRTEGGEAFLEVRDDGRGGRIGAAGGIEGMRSRLAEVGGRLEIGTRQGIRVRAWVPV